MTGRPIRLGLLGAGRWGKAYIRTIRSLPQAALTRVASRNPETRMLVGDTCAVSADWREVTAARDLDGVVVATPPALHAEMAAAALRSGLAVLVEKPLTLDVGEAERLLALAEQWKRPVVVEHTFLFHPAYRRLKAEAARLGPIRRIRCLSGNHGPFRPDVPPLWDHGAHDVAFCLDLLGARPSRATAAIEKKDPTLGPHAENVLVRLDFSGIEAEIRVGNLMPAKYRRFEVHFDEQALILDDLAPDQLVCRDRDASGILGNRRRAIETASTPPLTCAVQSFLEAIAANDTGLESLTLGLEVVRTLAACAP